MSNIFPYFCGNQNQIMQYPVIDFTDPNLDYEQAEKQVKAMYACFWSQGEMCCKDSYSSQITCKLDILMQGASINKTTNEERYRSNLKDVYDLLFPLTICYEIPVNFEFIVSTGFVGSEGLLITKDGETTTLTSDNSTVFSIQSGTEFSFTVNGLATIQTGDLLVVYNLGQEDEREEYYDETTVPFTFVPSAGDSLFVRIPLIP